MNIMMLMDAVSCLADVVSVLGLLVIKFSAIVLCCFTLSLIIEISVDLVIFLLKEEKRG
jgi:hypothetical protein